MDKSPRKPDKAFMMRLSDKDRELFVVAAKEDGFEELAPWLRWLAKNQARKTLGNTLPSASMDTSRSMHLRTRRRPH
jgi:hypothetical protein